MEPLKEKISESDIQSIFSNVDELLPVHLELLDFWDSNIKSLLLDPSTDPLELAETLSKSFSQMVNVNRKTN